eukprot:scaffold40689_cov23-Cyclotella_meneghiniana.AAC.2
MSILTDRLPPIVTVSSTIDGCMLGTDVGDFVGPSVGDRLTDGVSLAMGVGSDEGIVEMEGYIDPVNVGLDDELGPDEGLSEGAPLGDSEGSRLGPFEGDSEG